jgi:NitT/TauT family transport system ATP-binding protein
LAPVVSLEHLSFRYPNATDWIFDDLSLTIEPNEFVAIVGGSGVGKSTILRIVAGLIAPQKGTVEITNDRRAGARSCALVFQDGRLMPWRTVSDNVKLGLEGLSLPQDETKRRVDEVLALTGLGELGDRWPYQLSGGQAQRVGIARALAVKPQILLMDEPFSAVDALTRRNLQTELQRIWEQSGAAVAFVTHDIEEAVFLADRVIVLGDRPARIVAEIAVPMVRPRERRAPEIFSMAAEIASRIEVE